MTISAKVIADSINDEETRLTTVQLEYPRFIHAELMTHKDFSRCASSSRAIPVEKMLKRIISDPALPVHWGSNQKGMQAKDELKGARRFLAQRLFLLARWPVVAIVYALVKLGLHKQVANRLLEPWGHISVVVTATRWANFFALRCHPDAQPEMQVLAWAIYRAMQESKPERLEVGEVHVPYVDKSEYPTESVETLQKISAARCARVSYLNHDKKKPSLAEDLALFDRLMGIGVGATLLSHANPKHASPTEHQALSFPVRSSGNLHGGWLQFRKTIKDEYISSFTAGGAK